MRATSDLAPLATGAAVVALLAVTGAFFCFRALAPSDGARHRDGTAFQSRGILVAPPDGSGGPLRNNDVVLAVEGVPLNDWLGPEPPPRPEPDVSTKMHYRVMRDGRIRDVDVTISSGQPIAATLRDAAMPYAVASLFLGIGLYVFVRRPRAAPAQALALLSAGLASAMTFAMFGWEVLDIAARPGVFWSSVLGQGSFYVLVAAAVHFSATFPRPLPLVRRWPALLALAYAVPLVWFFTALFAQVWEGTSLATLRRFEDQGGILAIVLLGAALSALLANTLLCRRDPTERRRLQVVGVGFAVTVSAFLAGNSVPALLDIPTPPDSFFALVFLPLPVAVAVALLRQKFLDIDTALNRSLVYATLTILLLTVYAAAVTVVATTLGSTGTVATLPATGLVAVLFAPVRSRVQRVVDAVMYGARRDPMHVLAVLGRDLEQLVNPDGILPAIVDAVASTLRLPHVAIELDLPGGATVISQRGARGEHVARFPLVHQGERLGCLAVAPRAGQRHLTPPEETLLQDVARHAGVAAHAARLVTELDAARQEALVVREEERNLLYRDLHDRLGPQLFGIAIQLDALTDVAAEERLRERLQALSQESQRALTDVRRLARGLRPSALEELGLVPALTAACSRLSRDGDGRGPSPVVEVRAPVHLPPLGAKIELTAYQVCLEAVANAVRHSKASRCHVRLGLAADRPDLLLEITDDGVGLGAGAQPGIGLSSMRQRVEDLGGCLTVEGRAQEGTRVEARLPVPVSP